MASSGAAAYFDKLDVMRRTIEGWRLPEGTPLSVDQVVELARQMGTPLNTADEEAAAMAAMDANGDGDVDVFEYEAWWKRTVMRGGADRLGLLTPVSAALMAEEAESEDGEETEELVVPRRRQPASPGQQIGPVPSVSPRAAGRNGGKAGNQTLTRSLPARRSDGTRSAAANGFRSAAVAHHGGASIPERSVRTRRRTASSVSWTRTDLEG